MTHELSKVLYSGSQFYHSERIQWEPGRDTQGRAQEGSGITFSQLQCDCTPRVLSPADTLLSLCSPEFLEGLDHMLPTQLIVISWRFRLIPLVSISPEVGTDKACPKAPITDHTVRLSGSQSPRQTKTPIRQDIPGNQRSPSRNQEQRPDFSLGKVVIHRSVGIRNTLHLKKL